ncbi:MAG: hypothetical protein V7607_1400 [Solirubrobacteraceae bacterium]
MVVVGALLTTGVLALPAAADDPSPVVNFSVRDVLPGAPVAISGALVNGAADAGRQVQLYERRAPFPGTWAVLQQSTAGADGSYSFSVVPVLKAYYSVVAPATATAGREASAGLLVTVRRRVSIKVSDRTPRKNQLVRFSGFISPLYPLGPGAVATLQRRDKTGAFTNLKAALLKAAGNFTSYRVRMHVKTPGVYRIAVPSSTYYGSGASVAVVVRVHR